jgi:hypothetical protein
MIAFLPRFLMLAALLIWQAPNLQSDQPPVATPEHMRYLRAVQTAAGAGQACAVLDAQLYPHAAPSLKDLRLFPASGAAGSHEIPYAITLSEPATQETESARVLNLGTEGGGRIAFDIEMPARAYTSVALELDPAVHDFIATATVSGRNALGGAEAARSLGTFTLFDLTSQRLSRDTTLPLAESTFRFLHVELTLSHAPGAPNAQAEFAPDLVRGAQVPPSRAAQILYTTIAETNRLTTLGRESRATFETPARVPVERVSFILAPGFSGNFSRDVRITAQADAPPKNDPNFEAETRNAYPETLSGSILRVHANEAGREIRTEQLSVPAVLGANLQRGAKIDVAIENGDDRPLPIAAVRLEMRERQLCFDASAAGTLSLYYGDDQLEAPVYDYARLFRASRTPLVATLGPEQQNPNYQPPADTRSFTDRHPEVLWIALIVVICVLGAVAVRASKNVGR